MKKILLTVATVASLGGIGSFAVAPMTAFAATNSNRQMNFFLYADETAPVGFDVSSDALLTIDDTNDGSQITINHEDLSIDVTAAESFPFNIYCFTGTITYKNGSTVIGTDDPTTQGSYAFSPGDECVGHTDNPGWSYGPASLAVNAYGNTGYYTDSTTPASANNQVVVSMP